MMRRLVEKATGRTGTGKIIAEKRAWVQFDPNNGWYDFPAEEFIVLPQRVISPYSLEAFWDYQVLRDSPSILVGDPRIDLGYLVLSTDTWIVCQEPISAWLGRACTRITNHLFNLYLDTRKKFKIFSPFQMWDWAQGVQIVPAAQRRPTYTNNTTLGPTDLIEALWEFSPPSLAKLAALSQQRKTGLVELLRLISMGERVTRGTPSPLNGA